VIIEFLHLWDFISDYNLQPDMEDNFVFRLAATVKSSKDHLRITLNPKTLK
jgi:hypothetical protein